MEEHFESLSAHGDCMNSIARSMENESTQVQTLNVCCHSTTCRERELDTIPHGREKIKTKGCLTLPTAVSKACKGVPLYGSEKQ